MKMVWAGLTVVLTKAANSLRSVVLIKAPGIWGLGPPALLLVLASLCELVAVAGKAKERSGPLKTLIGIVLGKVAPLPHSPFYLAVGVWLPGARAVLVPSWHLTLAGGLAN